MSSPYSPLFVSIVQEQGSQLYRLVNIGNLVLATDAPADIIDNGLRYNHGLISEFTSRTSKSGDGVPQYEIKGNLARFCPPEALYSLSANKTRLDVYVRAVSPSGAEATEILYRGYVGQIKSTDGMDFTVECLSLVHQADAKIGWVLSPSCNHRFGDKLCRYPFWNYRVSGSVTSIGAYRNVFSFNGVLPTSTNAPNISHYSVGYITRPNKTGQQCSVQLVQVNGTNLEVWLSMATYLPFEIGEQIELYPGCDLSVAHCQALANTSRFLGFTKTPTQARRLSGT